MSRKRTSIGCAIVTLLVGYTQNVMGSDFKIVYTPAGEPTNHNNAVDDTSIDCGLYWYNWDVYAGRDYDTHEALFANSVVQSFTQHSRRPFPTWNRASGRYFQTVGQHKFVYAPATVAPLTRCDRRIYNVRGNNGTELFTDRMIRAGQPLITDCLDRNDSPQEENRQRANPPIVVPMQILQNEGYCLDTTFVNQTGAYAKRKILQDQSIIMGNVLHMHRQELTRKDRTYEPLIRFCWGRPESDLLLLPLFPILGNVQHDPEDPNLKLQWRPASYDASSLNPDLFSRPFHEWNVFAEDPWAVLLPWLEVVATRDIAQDEALRMDFGANRKNATNVERQLPDGLFPAEWLANETRTTAWPEIATPSLRPGQVEAVRLTNGESLGTYQHRVGLPDHLSNTMSKWAQDLGLYNLLKRYVTDDTFSLPPMGEERNVFNGGRWWTRRFGKGWLSNLHMMSPDDDEATKQMHEALHSAGLDEVLRGVGNHFNLTTLTTYFPCFLVVSHCTHAHIHWDTDYPTMFNLILPLHQVDDEPELILADDAKGRHVPYKYEKNAGILLGMNGMHGTAPTDYREGGNYRIAMSISMGDFSKDDETVKKFIASWEDPPYPNYLPGQVQHSLLERVHWSKEKASSKSIGSPFVWFEENEGEEEDASSFQTSTGTYFSQAEVRQYT